MNRFAFEALQNYTRSQPNPDHLLRIIQLNTITAMTLNANSLAIQQDWLICDAISPFGIIGPLPAASLGAAPRPPSLTPTSLQLGVPHHPWIDLLPLPRMRDNLLMATCVSGMLSDDDEDQLWTDLVECAGSTTEATGMIVWGDASDPRNWEATIPFLKRWWGLLEGCDEILQATNDWRRRRGERCLRFNT